MLAELAEQLLSPLHNEELAWHVTLMSAVTKAANADIHAYAIQHQHFVAFKQDASARYGHSQDCKYNSKGPSLLLYRAMAF